MASRLNPIKRNRQEDVFHFLDNIPLESNAWEQILAQAREITSILLKKNNL